MGVLSDIVIAQDHEAEAIGATVRPADTWPTLEAKGLDTIRLATLYEIMSGVDVTGEAENSFPLVGGDQDDSPWVFAFLTRCSPQLRLFPIRILQQ